jgi:phosphatidylserine decarboxylase
MADSVQLDASTKVLEHITDNAVSNHGASPTTTLNAPAKHETSHTLLARFFPAEYIETVESKWHMGNFVIDRITGEKHWEDMSIYVRIGMHLLYYGTEQERTLQWKRTVELLRAQSEKMGKAYDDPTSKEHIRPFIESFKLEDTLVELKKSNPDDYSCFNEFFSRELKDGARPVDEPSNGNVVSSPADCRLTAFPTIDTATKYWIKGHGFTLERLLDDKELADTFDGGSIVIARLAPQDYHRWHSPVNGTVKSVKTIPGAYYTVNPQAINEEGSMDVFCENKRSVMVVSTKDTNSEIAIVAVGAMLVGSIIYNDGIEQPGAIVNRGQCLGAFQYGGSTVIVVFPKGKVGLDDDLVKNSTEQACETLVRVGWKVGIEVST